jgi:hypothetical protein
MQSLSGKSIRFKSEIHTLISLTIHSDVRAGAGGCPLAQTLIEDNKKVLLIERGGERNANSANKKFAVEALLNNPCIESFSSQGVVVATGNCMGGATSFNQGIFIEETPGWFEDQFADFFSPEEINDAYTWVRRKVYPTNANVEFFLMLFFLFDVGTGEGRSESYESEHRLD